MDPVISIGLIFWGIFLSLIIISVFLAIKNSSLKSQLNTQDEGIKTSLSECNSTINENEQIKDRLSELEEKKHEYNCKIIEAENQIKLAKRESANAISQGKQLFLERQELRKKYIEAKSGIDREIERIVKEKTDYLSESIKFHPNLVKPFHNLCDIENYRKSIMQGVLQNAFQKSPIIEDIEIKATIRSSTSNRAYNTTLYSCDCPDHGFRDRPCKHMLYLAYLLGLLQIRQKEQEEYVDEYMEWSNRLSKLKKEATHYQQVIDDAKNEHVKIAALNNEFEKAIKNKLEGFSHIAGMIADILTIHYSYSSDYLLHKSRPAPIEAKRINELREETKKIIQDKKILEYKLEYIEKLFPNINDIFDSGFDESSFDLETEETTDRVRLFLTPEEYSSLSTSEKNQLALDRYIESRKSKWQIGRDYEMYVGHKLENEGYKVQYIGIIENLEDMGRDLIASKGKSTLIVQCKNWSQEKTIHEKHIFQLYGTIVLYRLDNPFFDVKGVFITTTKLSEKAKAVAKELDINIIEQFALGDFPRIKCNINRMSGEKIYHLPFDQQYDTTVINKNDGETYTFTVKEAEDQGFRRACRHFT